MIILCSILSVLLIVAIVAVCICYTIIKRQFAKIDALDTEILAYESKLAESNSLLDDYEKWILNRRAAVAELHKNLVDVDSKKLFEKDDDVGFVFSEILRLVKEFNSGMK